jgi:hypothetical protein
VYSSGVSSTDGDQPTLSAAELTSLVSTLQVELLGLKSRVSDRETENDSLRETILNLTHENELLKRRIYGNKTERTGTSELQLTLGNLLDDEKLLQKKLDAAVAEAQEGAQKDEEAPANPAAKAKPKGRRDCPRARCRASRSRSSMRSSRRARSGSASTTRGS